jgi:hypothetical protein
VINVEAAFSEQLLDIPSDRAYRRYQRTARTITSGGNRNPANSDAGTGGQA